jgi:hypothetical protein
MALSAVHSGAFSGVAGGKFSVLHSSAWTAVQTGYVLHSGVWTQFYANILPPTGFSATDTSFCFGGSNYKVSLAWTQSDSSKSTRIYRGGVLIATTGSSVSSYDDTSSLTNTSYAYAVTTYDSGTGAESISATASVTLVDPCA